MAGSFADSPRNGAWGDRPYSLIDFAGPASYTQVTNATANNAANSTPTGGQAITPAAFGLSAPIEGIFVVGGSLSGTYSVMAFETNGYQLGQPNGTWILRWIVAATGAEVANGVALNNEIVRLIGFGPY
jgi:hypothetical protein